MKIAQNRPDCISLERVRKCLSLVSEKPIGRREKKASNIKEGLETKEVELMGFFSRFSNESTDLIGSNLKVYFNSLSNGSDHKKAIAEVIRTRYPSIESHRAELTTGLEELRKKNPLWTCREETITLIYLIWCMEKKSRPSAGVNQDIVEMYNTFLSRYSDMIEHKPSDRKIRDL